MPSMDHSYIDEHNIIALYEMGKLPSESCADFEDHLIDCLVCQQELATAQAFRQGLKAVTTEDVVRQPVFTPALHGMSSWTSRRTMLAMAAACIVLMSISVASVLVLVKAKHQLTQVQVEVEKSQQQYLQAKADLQEGPKAQEKQGSGASALEGPFPLVTVRGDDQSNPVNWVTILPAAKSVLLEPDIDEESVVSYRAILLDSAKHRVWEETFGLPAATVEIAIPRSHLHQGTYFLTVEVRDRNGHTSSYSYPFSVQMGK